MELLTYLKGAGEELVTAGCAGIARAHLAHYEAAREVTRARLQVLFDRIVEALQHCDLSPIIEHAKAIAEERFESGCDLGEVQVAFNVFEEVIWLRILEEFPPADFAKAIGLISTVIGAGKDVLARAYVSLATRSRVPSLDLRELLAGGAG